MEGSFSSVELKAGLKILNFLQRVLLRTRFRRLVNLVLARHRLNNENDAMKDGEVKKQAALTLFR